MSYNAELSNAQLEKSAIWQVDNPITEEQLDFIIDEAYRLGQCYYQYLGKTACLTVEMLNGETLQ